MSEIAVTLNEFTVILQNKVFIGKCNEFVQSVVSTSTDRRELDLLWRANPQLTETVK